MNCYQIVEFCPNGKAEMILTDIQNPGTYSIEGLTIQTSWDHTIENPEKIKFEIAPDKDLLVDDYIKVEWKLDVNPEFPVYCP